LLVEAPLPVEKLQLPLVFLLHQSLRDKKEMTMTKMTRVTLEDRSLESSVAMLFLKFLFSRRLVF